MEFVIILLAIAATIVVIAKTIISLFLPVLYTGSSFSLGYMAWATDQIIPFDDIALAMIAVFMVSAVTLAMHALPAWRQAAVDLYLISDQPKKRTRR